MTGVGSYFYIVWAIWLRHCLNERQDEFMLHWTSIWRLPEVVPISKVWPAASNRYSANGHSNGHAKSEQRKSV
jgi:dihydroceramidase